MSKRIGYVLIVDNEYENISDLEEAIEKAINRKINEPIFLVENKISVVESGEEAIEEIKRIREEGDSLSAIIVDNHLYGEIDGEDLLRILRGDLPYCITKKTTHIGIKTFKYEDFETLLKSLGVKKTPFKYFFIGDGNLFQCLRDYSDFTRWYQEQNKCEIMLCGRPSEIDTRGIEDIPMIQKKDGCEKEVLYFLERANVFEHDEISIAVENVRRLAEGLPYSPNNHHIKKRKKSRKT